MIQRLKQAHCNGAWMIVAKQQVVGLCSFKAPPVEGRVELGYGISPGHRGQGHATAAMAEVIEASRRARSLRTLAAEVATTNVASTRVLQKNGFALVGHRQDSEDGLVEVWEREVEPA